MGLIARTRGAFYGPATGRDSERKTMAVVAEANDDADRFLRMVVGGRPLSGSVMQETDCRPGEHACSAPTWAS